MLLVDADVSQQEDAETRIGQAHSRTSTLFAHID